MKVVLLSIGSRGDVEPFCALAQSLLQRNIVSKKNNVIEVEFFVEENQSQLTDPLIEEFSNDDHHLTIHFFPFAHAGFVKKARGQPSQLEETARVYQDVILPAFDMVWDVVKDSDVVVSCNLTNMLCILIHQRLMERSAKEIAFVFIHLQPLAPNTIFPCYRTTSKQEVVTAILDHFFDGKNISTRQKDYLDSYWKMDEQFYKRLFGEDKQTSATSPPSMCSWEEYKDIFSGKHPRFMICNAYSRYLVPMIAGTSPLLGKNIVDVGPLADDYHPIQSTEEHARAMQQVTEFCEASVEKSICIGFGSMPFSRRQEIFQALQQLGNPRTILVGNALDPSSIEDKDDYSNILHVSSISYPWLFPKCSMMICHGGMGVLSSCLRAGIPAVVCPAMGDQFLTGSLVQGLGLGRQAGTSLNTLTSDQLVDAVRNVQSNGQIIERCRRVGERIQKEPSNGAERLAEWIL